MTSILLSSNVNDDLLSSASLLFGFAEIYEHEAELITYAGIEAPNFCRKGPLSGKIVEALEPYPERFREKFLISSRAPTNLNENAHSHSFIGRLLK
jgi:hypothetical protein